MENYFRVGVLTSTHGLTGGIKVFPTTDCLDRFDSIKRAFIDLGSGKGTIKGNGMLEVEVENVKYFKNTPIVTFKGIDNVDLVAKYKGMDLLVAREDALPLAEGEHYVSDVIGCKVISDTGANKVLVVKPNEAHKELKEFYLPHIPECVLEINTDEGFVKVHIMKGLLD